MKVFITKYALTQGIFETNGEICESISPDMFKANSEYGTYYHGDDWHKTREGAVAKAEEMRLRKIVSLKKSISKLEKLTF